MHAADLDRRLARDEPGLAALRAPRIGQVAAGATHLHPLDAERCLPPRLRQTDPRGAQAVDDFEEQRCRGLHAHQRRIAGAIEIAHPHHQRVGPDQADAPRIAKSPGRAGLPCHGQVCTGGHQVAIGTRIFPQHVTGDEGSLRADQAGTGFESIIIAPAQRSHPAIVAQHCIQACEFFHACFAAAQDQGQAVMALAGHVADAGAAEELIEAGLRELRCNGNGGNVAAAHQRVRCGDGAKEAPVEIFRCVRPECGRHIAQDRGWMQHALVQRQRVDERLQRRTG